MNGLIRIFWKAMVPATFEYRANCDADGRCELDRSTNAAAAGDEQAQAQAQAHEYRAVRHMDDELQAQLRCRIDRAMRKYRLIGAVMILFSVVIHVPWVVALVHLQHNLTYEPSGVE